MLKSLIPWFKAKTRLAAATQAKTPSARPLPPVPPANVYTQFALNLATLTVREQQQLMEYLYRTNFITRDLVRQVVDQVVGDGFGIGASDDIPRAKDAIIRYQQFNELDQRNEIKTITKQYLNTGELLFLTAPYRDTWYSVRCPPVLIRQTLLDPKNPQKVIGVLLEPDYFAGDVYFYRTITDESRLSPEALYLRSFWGNQCFYAFNNELDELIDAPGWDWLPTATQQKFSWDILEWSTRQRRGTPFFNCWADLFNQLSEVLWAMLDKTKSWGAFNYWFTVDTQGAPFDESVRKVKQWQDVIGTPEMNSAIYTNENVKITPMNFTMQSQDMQRILDIMLQVTGLSANVPPYDLGMSAHTPYATAHAQGSPKETFMQSIQSDVEEMLLSQYHHIARESAGISTKERQLAQSSEHLWVTSPELKTKDKAQAATIFRTAVDTLNIIAAWGVHDPDSLADAANQLAKEHLNLDLITLTPEQRNAAIRDALDRTEQAKDNTTHE